MVALAICNRLRELQGETIAVIDGLAARCSHNHCDGVQEKGNSGRCSLHGSRSTCATLGKLQPKGVQ